MVDIFAFSPTTVLLCVAVLVLLWLLTRRPSGLPPGPPLLRFFGNALSMGFDPRVTFKKLRQKYGDIFSVYLFNKPLIVLNGYSTLKEAIVKNADVFSERPHTTLNDFIARGKGELPYIGSHLCCFKHLQVLLEHLESSGANKDDSPSTPSGEFGAGRNIMEDKIHEEISQFIEALEAERRQSFDCKRLVHNAVSNVICSTVFGKRFEFSDPLFITFLKAMEKNVANVGAAGVLNVLPIVRFFQGDLFKFKVTMQNVWIN
ncbi:cytochrome P450 2B5-like [Haliotis rubra]|uniref:cytochrome P450 2B5-like n=1 Tax=Haliotis rubra TaxID=36100 RepID=UPI001EE58D25|nr:cytochrome P450 2B5-like [Haliotis rubra]